MSFAGAFPMLGGVSLRFSTPADENFLLDMFLAARPWLVMTSDNRDFVRFLLEDQYRITLQGREGVYPEHLDFVIEKTGQAVGHLTVNLGYADWRISQLEVHPLARGKGIGRDVVRSLQAAAANAKVRLTVGTLANLQQALAFYAGLGFRVVTHAPPVVELAWLPEGMAWPAPAVVS